MKRIFKNTIAIFFVFFLLLINTAFANVGVPMIFITFPVMLIALIPMVLIEAGVLKKLLKVGYKKAILSSSLANIISTIIGFPLSWRLLFMVGGGCGPVFEIV